MLAVWLPAPPAAWAQPTARHLAPPAEQSLRLAVEQLRRGLAQDQARRHPVPGAPHAVGQRIFFLAEAANKITLAYAPATAPGQQAGRAYAVRYHRLTQHWGLFDNDAADVLAAYLLLSWQVVPNAPDTTAVAQAAAQGLRVQTASVLARHLPTTAAAAQFGEQLKRHAVLLHRG